MSTQSPLPFASLDGARTAVPPRPAAAHRAAHRADPADPADLERDRRDRAALALLAEPGDLRVAAGVALVGAAELYRQVLDGTAEGGLADDARVRAAASDAERALERAERTGIRFVVPGDAEWPAGLDGLAWAGSAHQRGGVPLGLWARGPVRLHDLATGLAVVGARSATTYGTDQAARISHDVARAGLPVVSGAAFGVDIAAHRGALAAPAGRTAAVLACGVDRGYPQAHERYIDAIAAEHVVVSETAPGMPPSRIRFLSRNRLIAALTDGTLVVEAALRSGALSTAHWATRLGRHLVALPGPVTSEASRGTHRLLREGEASLVTDGADVLEVLGRAGQHLVEPERSPQTLRDRLTVRERQVLDAVPFSGAAELAHVARTAGVSTLGVTSALGRLVRCGLLEQDGAGFRLTGKDADAPDDGLLDSSA
ncbi:DNA-processing protein DprA [Nocardioides bruguierae]|uniref:DNA-processing protein DprA n=1 Tax=Nocardioides bruguierae TaxID=2945102 RepID=A0A9X2IDD8_9ACTN|nr:DNA-processing protein DprA [Nocardioides bruguierae]MCL8026626.1 DNA-processing protein DprA [Nocardioides bruguierae]MCM0619641.1 DNA-processing protein DprA [Nocardioides bruguierae]